MSFSNIQTIIYESRQLNDTGFVSDNTQLFIDTNLLFKTPFPLFYKQIRFDKDYDNHNHITYCSGENPGVYMVK